MKSMIARALTSLAIVLITTPLFAAGTQSNPQEKTFDDPAPFTLKNPDVKRFESPDGRRAMEVITGDTALGVLQNLKSRHRAQLEKSAAVLREKGYTMTSEVVVVRKIDLQARAKRNGAIQPVSDSYADSDGEVIFWSWTDGDDSTWEGTVYVANYQNGGYTYIDGQIDTLHDELAPVWEQTTSYYGGSGGGGGGCNNEYNYSVACEQQMTKNLLRDKQPVQIASVMSDLRYAIHNEMEPAEYNLAHHYGSSLRSWGKCFVVSCGVAATTCRWAGPAWGKCSLAGCGASAVLCGVAEMF